MDPGSVPYTSTGVVKVSFIEWKTFAHLASTLLQNFTLLVHLLAC
jgi:hypothetical protein